MVSIKRRYRQIVITHGAGLFPRIVGVLFATAFFVLADFFISRINDLEISCIKRGLNSADCQFTTIPKFSIFFFHPSTQTYSEITQASPLTKVEEYTDGEGDTSYREINFIVLKTERGLVMEEVDSSHRARWASSQINEFLSGGQNNLAAVRNGYQGAESYVALFFSIILLFFSLVLFWNACIERYTSLDINGYLNQVIITRIDLFSNVKTFLDFSDVESINFIESLEEDDDGDETKVYDLKLQTRTEGEIPLDKFYSYQEEIANNLGNEIAALIGCPMDRKVLSSNQSNTTA